MHVLRLYCDDQPGIVAAVAVCLSEHGCNIEESAQFHDDLSAQFFMRTVFNPQDESGYAGFMAAFEDVAVQLEMTWQVTPLAEPVKTLIMVSKPDHCLNDLLYRWRTDHLQIEMTGVVSNHETNRKLVEDHGLTYHHLPVTKDTKPEQEAQVREIIEGTGTELIILARYMQILSAEMCAAYPGRIINIHHSFLPGFKGAKPYHQAYERGVKIIGASAHFATANLDEGPIIKQDTVHVDHTYTPEKMQALGRDTESRVLARAIAHYTERRIFLHGSRTVIL